MNTRDRLFPYAMFFIGVLVGAWRPVQQLTTPIHEIGHVLAAFLSGGYGWWKVSEWNVAHTVGGNANFIAYAGVFAELLFGVGIAVVLILKRKGMFLAGVLASCGIIAGHFSKTQRDWRGADSALADPLIVIFMIIGVVAIVWALFESFGRSLAEENS